MPFRVPDTDETASVESNIESRSDHSGNHLGLIETPLSSPIRVQRNRYDDFAGEHCPVYRKGFDYYRA